MSFGTSVERERFVIARRSPCFEAEETIDPRFAWRADLWSFVLTANTGFE